MTIYTLLSLGLYFIAMLLIGWYAYRTTQANVDGFLLGGRQLSPSVMALSAGASDMSGWILMGLPGAIYVSGLSSAWIAVGLVIGAYLNYLLIAPRLRVFTEIAGDAVTIPDFLNNRFASQGSALRIIAALVIIIFFTLYTSAGLVSGGKLFASAFGQDYHVGIILTASVVVAYTLFGGFLAVSMTDFVQGSIMLVAMIAVPYVAFTHTDNTLQTLQDIDPSLLSMVSGVTIIGAISSAAWGLGYFGQPHIIVRFMAISDVKDMPVARRIGIGWMLTTILGAIAIGMVGHAYVTEHSLTLTDPETVFIVLSQLLFHPFIGGLLLAAILAAIMSTISSQLLVSASSISEDIYHKLFAKSASQKSIVLVSRVAILAVCFVAGLLAMNPNSSILNLVGNAWAGFGAAFGPLIILALFWQGLTYKGAIGAMLSGTATVLFWIYGPLEINGQSAASYIYEIVPGFLVALTSGIIISKLDSTKNPQISQTFTQFKAQLNAQ